jgi:hypothetical protein
MNGKKVQKKCGTKTFEICCQLAPFGTAATLSQQRVQFIYNSNSQVNKD